ncbi:hypothetical protein EIL87_25800 [Saccharopolyspora rhizosphaerae]|uniref:DUF3093 domain-containing protein n=1 Tax=Saccharopolyspora rhizosphaerae TaxID=2492662 RepID=A0A426JIS3_9PSEU|nr:DUF3093 family protein [Saccharopolyspora rhizosphaerae]RRO13065.1 hypothetical protein EIL87_25800 [Saccharopolyspora rhizosphaerae]
MSDPVLYSERGSSWWPVLWGPVFAALGLVVEQLTLGPRNVAMWVLVGLALAVAAAIWAYGRRRLLAVSLTRSELVLGREQLATDRITAVREVGAPVGARVLGGSWTVPKGTGEIPLRLDDDTVVLAWARNSEVLSEELAKLVGEKSEL